MFWGVTGPKKGLQIIPGHKLVAVILETIKVKMKSLIFFNTKSFFYMWSVFRNKIWKSLKKDLWNPWITRGINESSKRKVRLYLRSLKFRINKNVFQYRNYGKPFELIKKLAKRNCFWSVIFNFGSNIKKTLICNEECIRENDT